MNILGTAATIFTTTADLRVALFWYDANPTAAIAKYGPIAGWDVSRITDMSWLFYELGNFNADISSWNTSHVTSMWGMFHSASAFNQPLTLDTSSVINMGRMFYSASAFNQPLSLDTSRVTYTAGVHTALWIMCVSVVLSRHVRLVRQCTML